jgi:glycosyltransferase involved in cell wall biosynthesis
VSRVSVIIPVRNGAATIESAVNSLVWQTYDDLKIIIVNDRSTDNTYQLCERMADASGKIVLVNNTGQGISSALNYAIALSDSEYIARMDADDISFPERIARQVDLLDNAPQIAVVGSSFMRFGALNKHAFVPIGEDACYYCSRLFSPFCHPTTVFRRSALAATGGGYDGSYDGAEDFELFSRMLDSFQGTNIEEPLFAYRIHPSQVSATQSARQKSLSRRIIKRNVGKVVAEMGQIKAYKTILENIPRPMVPNALRSFRALMPGIG